MIFIGDYDMRNNKKTTRKTNKRKVAKKLDIHGNPVGDYRGKKWSKKLGRFVYT